MPSLPNSSSFIVVAVCLVATILPCSTRAQPTALGTNLVNGADYFTYPLTDLGIFRQSRLEADADLLPGGVIWEFPESSFDYDPVWRPYSGICNGNPNTFIPSFDVTILPNLVYPSSYASATYNTGFGGCNGFLPFITNGNYYTFNITEYSTGISTQDETMSVLETTYQPIDILTLTQDPASGVTEANNVLVSVTLSAPLSAGEYLYLRYSSTYNFTASTLLELNEGVGFHFEYIPCSTDSVYYYVFTSNQDSAYIMSQVATYGKVAYDMMTLDLINNGGPNYIYYPLPSAEPCFYTLPVELLRFDLLAENKLVYLSWETASEINSDYFDIQRSYDGHFWEHLGIIFAQGNTAEVTSYVFVDDDPLTGGSYYRLRMVDLDNTFTFSPIRAVWNESTSAYVEIAPNPASSEFQLMIYSDVATAIQISVTDMRGTAIYQSVKSIESGFQTIPMDVSTWAGGIYVVEYRLQNGIMGKEKLFVTD